MIGIYKITSPSGKIYIGQTTNYSKRHNAYKNHKCKLQPKLFASIEKYGFINHIIEIVKECEVKDLNYYERYYQEYYESVLNGLNLRYTATTDKSGFMSEESKTTSILRDLLNEDFNKIVVNDKNIFTETKSYIQRIAPEKVEIVSLYNQSSPIFDSFGITKQVKAAFGKTVNLPSGAYLIIEHTEALHVIDVNSGYKSVSNNQEENALETNLEAAEEIARQLRLRDLGGIIVVDFIDMKLMENKKRLADAMEQFMRTDRAKHAVLQISKFGLMQITRQRMKPEMNINTSEICPSCSGTGKISSTLILEDEIEKNLSYLIMQKHKGLTIQVNPILHTFLTSGFISKRRKWSWKYKQKIKVVANSNYHLTEFHFFDNSEEEIKL
jgi:ribonuclease G